MKKLMIAVAIVCAAAFAQAASIDWQFGETALNDPASSGTGLYHDPVNLSGMTLYIFESSVWTGGKDLQGGYSSEILAKAWGSTVLGDPAVSGQAPYTQWVWSNVKGTIPADASKGIDITKDATYALTYVISDGDNYQAMNGTQAAKGYDPLEPGTVTPGLLSIAVNQMPFTNAGMTAFTNVPEPTSGLLLLLGVAGLALRRRRA